MDYTTNRGIRDTNHDFAQFVGEIYLALCSMNIIRRLRMTSFGGSPERTVMDANGENKKVIQELLRHANLKVAMDR
jgi:hypothetical protein